MLNVRRHPPGIMMIPDQGPYFIRFGTGYGVVNSHGFKVFMIARPMISGICGTTAAHRMRGGLPR
jgi:hypothetical protein